MDQATIDAIANDIEALEGALTARGLNPARVGALLPAFAGPVLVFETSAVQVSARQAAQQPRPAGTAETPDGMYPEDWRDTAGRTQAVELRDQVPAVLS